MLELIDAHFSIRDHDSSAERLGGAGTAAAISNPMPATGNRPLASARPHQSASDPSRALPPEELITRHQAGVWRYLRLLGCDPATADDLTQETFLKVLSRKNFVQHSDAATSAYLRRTAHNLLVSLHRRGGSVKQVDAFETIDEVWNRWAGADLTGDEAVDALQDCLKALSQRAQKALRMRFAEAASRAEIGAALGITEHGARNLMQRAKQQLRTCVELKLK